jgi:hypothetical protein
LYVIFSSCYQVMLVSVMYYYYYYYYYVFRSRTSSSTMEGSILLCRCHFCCFWYSLTDWLLNCRWPSPAPWIVVSRPTGTTTIFYTLTVLALHFTSNINQLYEDSVRTSQETHHVFATKPNRLMLFRERVAVYCENHTEHTPYGRIAQFQCV